MKLDLFSKGDSVLLLGEGNFSFSVALHKHNIPLRIVATCFESEPQFEHQLANIDYLKSHKVPVVFNVDATKLRENPFFSDQSFSKIVFNFPHVGGKMKIHKNRALLRGLFQNSAHLLAEDGLLIVSLCRGQGGTPADQPQRKWHDSWQITEMAAHGDFLLLAVDPFVPHNFPDYHCIGYRSQDVHFHLSGALVHVFARGKPPLTATLPPARLAYRPIEPRSDLLLPVIYAELYQVNPMRNPHSPISFLKNLLLGYLPEWNVLEDDDVPFHVDTKSGVHCRANNFDCRLRATPFDIFPHFLKLLFLPSQKNTLFPGTYFRPLATSFSIAPLRIHFTIGGQNLLPLLRRFLKDLVDMFEGAFVSSRSMGGGEGGVKGYSVTSREEFMLESRGRCVQAGVLWRIQFEGKSCEVCVINAEDICEHIFEVGWREVWAEKTRVVVEEGCKPRLVQRSLYPNEYKLDVTLRYREAYSEERLYEVLWLAGGQVIEEVKLLSEYTSKEGWSSKCYRLVYKSLDKPLFRERVVEIHEKIVSRVLELGLNVDIG